METVFGEKIRRPEVRGLVRDRLGARLVDPTGPPLGLVLGPAGSGKTTLLSSIAAACTPSAWYRAADEDGDEAALVRHLAAAIGGALADREDARRLLDCAAAESVRELINALQGLTGHRCLLIIDDLHEIAGTAAESALERFVELRPRTLRILMASRRPPLINIPRLLVSGELCQLDTDDLRFRSWEVEELFRDVYGRPLSPSAAAALTRRTGGWAAGLQLFHLATQQLTGPDRERAIEGLSGRSRLIRSYLARNVLGGLAAARRSFLLRTCTLGVLTGDLCDALLDTEGSAGVLDQLETEQFFTTSTDGGLTYHYHQVLQTHLEMLLVDELGGRTARDLYARSAALLEKDGRLPAAVRAYARAEDWAAVARLAPDRREALDQVDHDQFSLRQPASGLASSPDPMLALAAAHRLLRNGQLEPAISVLRHAESLLDDPEFRRRCAAERAAAALWLPQQTGLLLGRAAPVPRDRDGLVTAELRRLSLARSERPARSPLTTGFARGVAALLAGDPGSAVRELAGSTDGLPPDGWEALAVRLTTQLADYQDRCDPSIMIMIDDIVLDADAAGQAWLARLARGVQACLLLSEQPSRSRLDGIAAVITECERLDDRWGAALLCCVLGDVHRAAGRPAAACDSYRTAVEHAEAVGAPALVHWAGDRRHSVEQHAGMMVDAADRTLTESPVESPPESPDGITDPMMIKPAIETPRVAAVIGEALDPLLRGAARPSARPVIELECLGAFALRVDGTEVGWRTLRPRAQTLLMVLATRHGRDVHREHLIDALWPDASVDAGTRRLQVAISSVRQCLIGAGLPEDCVRRRGDAYALHLSGVQDQLGRFEELAARAIRNDTRGYRRAGLQDRLDALDLYSGDLLPEVGPAEWVVEERDRLRTLAATIAADAARLAAAVDDVEVGIRAARRSIELDPYHDPAWQLLITLQQQAGDGSGAMVSRREHARIRADLGCPA